jgi:hypothetical protein
MASVYWIRSLVPIEQEIQPPHEHRQRERRRRHLDHAADLDRGVVGNALVVELLLRLLEHVQRLLDLVRMREHRQQDLHVAELRGAQDRAQLREEELRLGEAVADGAQAERRIRHLHLRRPFDRLVGAEVQGADHHRAPVHGLGHFAVGLELLVLPRAGPCGS